MTLLRHRLLRLLGLLGALACPLAFLLLLQIRPPLPPLPSSLSSPVTLELVRSVLDLAAWGGSLGLAALLLVHSLRALFASAPPRRPLPRIDPPPRDRPLAQKRLAEGARQGGFPPPFPLILSPRPLPDPERERALAPAPVQEEQTAAASAWPRDDERRRAVRVSIPRWEQLPPPWIAMLGKLKIAVARPGRYALRSQTQQLLVYLALHPEGAPTEELVAALCPQVDEGAARKRLWQAVSEARSQLGDVIDRIDDRYALDRASTAVDVDHFEQLVDAATSAQPGSEREELLARALALVRGQPLDGSDFPWAAGEVRRLRAIVVERLGELGRIRLKEGNAAGAVTIAERALELDAYHEAAHRLAMRAEAALGLRQAIVQRYEQLSLQLDSALGLEPDRETRVLYRRLLSQDPEESRAQ